VGTNPEMAKRLKYSKEILNQLLNGQQQKRWKKQSYDWIYRQ
jgi:hypothetical protein